MVLFTVVSRRRPGLIAVPIWVILRLRRRPAGLERRNAKGMWVCPRCAHKNALKQIGAREHADEAPAGAMPPDRQPANSFIYVALRLIYPASS